MEALAGERGIDLVEAGPDQMKALWAETAAT